MKTRNRTWATTDHAQNFFVSMVLIFLMQVQSYPRHACKSENHSGSERLKQGLCFSMLLSKLRMKQHRVVLWIGKMMWFIVPRFVSWWMWLCWWVHLKAGANSLESDWIHAAFSSNTFSSLSAVWSMSFFCWNGKRCAVWNSWNNYFQMLQYVKPRQLQKHFNDFFFTSPRWSGALNACRLSS